MKIYTLVILKGTGVSVENFSSYKGMGNFLCEEMYKTLENWDESTSYSSSSNKVYLSKIPNVETLRKWLKFAHEDDYSENIIYDLEKLWRGTSVLSERVRFESFEKELL